MFFMEIKREIGEKGQVVVPKNIRDLLGLKKGQKVVFQVKGEEVFMRPEQEAEDFVKDFLDVPGKEKKGSVKEIKSLLEDRYEKKVS